MTRKRESENGENDKSKKTTEKSKKGKTVKQQKQWVFVTKGTPLLLAYRQCNMMFTKR